MAITIAKLSTVSTLDSSKFSAGLAKMRTDIGAFSAISFGAFSRVGGMITNFAGRAIRALPSMVLHSLAAGDALEELASQLGFSTSALANLQRVAGLSGIDIGGLETSIGKMNTTLGEAMTGNKAAGESFKELGLDFQALAKQSPESTFFAVLDALKQIPSTAQRSSAAVQLFGRSGRAMLKLIGLGSAGIGAEAINTRRMGIASRPSDMASMGRASDTLDDLKNNLKGFGDQLAIRLAPQIEHVGKEFLGFSTKTNLAANAAEFFATSLQTSALYIAQILDQFSIVGIGSGNLQQQLFQSLNRANQKPTRPPGASSESMESLTPREQRKRINAERMAKTMNSPMAVAARKKNAELESKRAAVLESGYERMRGIPEELRRPTPGSTNTGSRYQIIETRIFDEMLEELKQINTKTKRGNGGASP